MYFGFKERKLLVSTLVKSNFDYGVNSWFRGLTQKVKTIFQTTQHRLIRCILNYDGRHHLCSEDFKLVGWLNVNDQIEYLSLCLMYKIHVKKLLDIYVMLNSSSIHTILGRKSCRTLYQKLSPMDRKRLNIATLNIGIDCLYQYESQTV